MSALVVTGMGILTGLGRGKAATWRALEANQTAVAPVHYLATRHSYLLMSEVKMSDSELRASLHIPANQLTTRNSLLGMVAMQEALAQANLTPSAHLKVAFVNGTTVGGIDQLEQHFDLMSQAELVDYLKLYPCGSSTDAIADFVGGFSSVTTVSTACSSAANALIVGAMLLRSGRAQIAVVGGTECLSKYHVNGFQSLKVLDSSLCKPFDQQRAGLNLGEGAAYLVLETEESARQRGVEILCQLSGYANTCDAFHQTAISPDGEGAYLAMTAALQRAQLPPYAIDYVNAHGTGTENNDATESAALRRVFGDQPPAISSTKAFTGHTTSAAGSVESVITILALQHQAVPANLNFTEKMSDAAISPVTPRMQPRPLRHVMTNSFGFGGNDSSCIFSKFE